MLVGGGLVLLIVLVAIFAPLLAPLPGDAGTATHPFTVLQPPSGAHLFGADEVGRDILSRVIYGTRVSPVIAAVVLVIACAIGVPLGVVAGYLGGWLDELIMRVTDVFLASRPCCSRWPWPPCCPLPPTASENAGSRPRGGRWHTRGPRPRWTRPAVSNGTLSPLPG